MTINQALQFGKKELSHIQTNELDSLVLLSHTLNKSKEYIFTNSKTNLSASEVITFKKHLSQRKKHIPVAYITGKKEFFGRNFEVTKHTLIPRPETEILIEYFLEYIKKNTKNYSIIDIGTGSGAIAITLAKELPTAHVTALDISDKALETAKKNAQQHTVKNITVIKSNLLNAIPLDCKPNIIFANLPYLSEAVYEETQPEIKHEPKIALTAEDNGMSLYKKLFNQIKDRNISTDLIIEINPEQYNDLTHDATKVFEKIKSHQIRSLDKQHILGIHFEIHASA